MERRYLMDFEGEIDLYDVPCLFDVELETYELEPTSWGQGRGTGTSAYATLKAVWLGDLRITREQAALVFGAATVSYVESAAEDRMQEGQGDDFNKGEDE